MSRIARKLSLSLLIAGAAIVAAEGALRAVLHARGEPWSAAAAEAELERLASAAAGDLPTSGGAARAKASSDDEAVRALHPYLGFDLARSAQEIERDLELLSVADPRRFTLMITGGSVAAAFANAGRATLLERLRADPRFAEREILVLTYARAAHKQPQQAIQLVHLLGLGLVPDAVLELDGFNELAIAATNYERGFHPAWPDASQWTAALSGAGVSGGGFERLGELALARARLLEATATERQGPWLASALVGRGILARARAAYARYGASLEAWVRAPRSERAHARAELAPPKDASASLELAVREWREGSRAMRALLEARGIPYLHVLQPTLLDPNSKPLAESERAIAGRPEWTLAVRAGYPLLRATGVELARAGEAFLDASQAFASVGEPLYYDACHFHPRGSELLAEPIADALLALFDERERGGSR